MKIRRKRHFYQRLLILLAALVLALGTATMGINWWVMAHAEPYFLTEEEACAKAVDCILILGAQVHSNQPSLMLRERLNKGIALYQGGASARLLMSGDHGRVAYDEVNTMKSFAIEAGVPSQDIFMDHAGFSTYESMYRARDIFEAKHVIIVTQRYHLYRAVYVARALGLDAYGVACDTQTYPGQFYREVREIVARCKDWVYTIIQPKPTFLGTQIPVFGNGDVTND